MPNLITHIEFAKKVYERLPDETKKIVEGDMQAYILGSIGPDVLFALRELGIKDIERYPNLLQFMAQYESFEGMRKYQIENPSDTRYAYMLGYLCHYVADKNLHPYVNYFQENVLAKDMNRQEFASLHSLIESALDTYVLISMRGYENPNLYKPNKELKITRKKKIEIGKIYEDVLNKIYGIPLTASQFSLSSLCTNAFMWFTNDKRRIKYKLVRNFEKKHLSSQKVTCLFRPVARYDEVDYLNLEKRPWRKVRNRADLINLSAVETFEVAVEEASKYYLPSFHASVSNDVPLDKDYFHINYEGLDTTII
ncbi:MAG TPA: zinc dependent phospholipase C family protein [Clostridiales bacterium]|nr:zinc dependent phospholipase C family protein [Clostridiales bacterium]